MKTCNALYKRFIFKFAINPFTYLISLIFIAATIIRFFLIQNFFSSTGSTDLRIFFQGFPYTAILAIPAFTAILPFSDEENYWPGNNTSIILSKILSLSSVILVSVLLTVFVPVTVSMYGDLQLSQVICGYLILLLYVAATSSLSVYLYTLISNKGIAFLTLSVILALVNASHLIVLYFKLPGWISALVKEMSFAWHYDAAGKGILDTRDIIFYLDICAIFFAASIFAIERRKGNFTSKFNQLRVLSVFAFVLILLTSGRIFGRIDTTYAKQFTVSSYSKKIMAEIDESLNIYYYRSPALKNIYPQVRDVEDFLTEYAGQSNKISLEILDPVKENVVSSLNNYGIYGEQIPSSTGDSVSLVYSAVVMNYLGRVEVIPVVYTCNTLEFDLTSRLEAMVLNVERNVQILTGNGLDLDEDYSYIEPWLQSMGFMTIHTYLPGEASETGQLSFSNLPDIPLLILGSTYFNQQDINELSDFINNGGKVFIATTPFTVDIANDWSINPQPDNLIYMLQKYGVYFKETLTADISNFRITFYSDTSTSGKSMPAQTEYVNYPLWPVLLKQPNALNGLAMFWPAAIDYDSEVAKESGYEIKELLYTSPNSWQVEKIDGQFQVNPFYFPQTAENPDDYESEVVCLELNNPKNRSQIIVYGDQYAYTKMMFNYAAGSIGDMRSFDFLLDSMIKLNGQEEILSLKNRNKINTSLYKIDSGKLSEIKSLVIFLTCLIPAFILLAIYIFVFIKRKNRNSAIIAVKH